MIKDLPPQILSTTDIGRKTLNTLFEIIKSRNETYEDPEFIAFYQKYASAFKWAERLPLKLINILQTIWKGENHSCIFTAKLPIESTNQTYSHITHITLPTTATNEDLKQLVKQCPNLQSIDLSGCSNVTDAGLEHLKDLKSLIKLHLVGCSNVTDAGIEHLKDLESLTRLDLSWCSNITDAGLGSLKDLASLTTLNLSWCLQITDAGVTHLKRARPSLEIIR